MRTESLATDPAWAPVPGRPRGRRRGALAALVGLLVVALTASWVWWELPPPAALAQRSSGVNGLWARHDWVGEAHPEADYRALAELVRQGQVSDVFFHVGPLDGDGRIPPERYGHAGELLAAFGRLAPSVRAQAYVGQKTVRAGGPLDLADANTRARIVDTAAALLALGFDGIHYDLEPIYPDEPGMLDLLERTRTLAHARGAVLSVAVEQLELIPGAQSLLGRVAPRAHYPARVTPAWLRQLADRVDQVAVMTYDTAVLPADWLVGLYFAHQAERVVELAGDRAIVFIGVPTYDEGVRFPWAENLRSAIRGARRGFGALDRPPAKPAGLAVFAEWTTDDQEWAHYRQAWVEGR
jgi:hypothetical protein